MIYDNQDPAPMSTPRGRSSSVSRRSKLIEVDHRLSTEKQRRQQLDLVGVRSRTPVEDTAKKKFLEMAPPPWFKGRPDTDYRLDFNVKMRKSTLVRLTTHSRQPSARSQGAKRKDSTGARQGSRRHHSSLRQKSGRHPRPGADQMQSSGALRPQRSWEETVERHRALENQMAAMEAMVAAQTQRRQELRNAVASLAAEHKLDCSKPPGSGTGRSTVASIESVPKAKGKSIGKRNVSKDTPDFVKRLVPVRQVVTDLPASRGQLRAWIPGGIHPQRKNISRTHFAYSDGSGALRETAGEVSAPPKLLTLSATQAAKQSVTKSVEPPDAFLAENLAYFDAATANRRRSIDPDEANKAAAAAAADRAREHEEQLALQQLVQQLVGMGYRDEIAVQALEMTGGDPDAAIDLIRSGQFGIPYMIDLA
eukprot:SAG31_NODE_2059_length_6539_cov_4.699845_6_plen_422_part_00